MRKAIIFIGISLLFFIGMAVQVSAQCWDLNGDRICDLDEDTNQDGKCNGQDCKSEPGIQAGEIRGIIDFCGLAGGTLVYIPGESFMVKTGYSGEFVFHYVQAGTYDLIVETSVSSPFTISDVQVLENEITDLDIITIPCAPTSYYTTVDTNGQAALDTEADILTDGVVTTGLINIGPGPPAYNAAIGRDLGSAQNVSKVRMYGDQEEWSNFKVLYNTSNNISGWTEVTNLTVTKYKEPDGLGGKYTNELSFDPVSARWWKVWANHADSTGVISVYEFDAYAE